MYHIRSMFITLLEFLMSFSTVDSMIQSNFFLFTLFIRYMDFDSDKYINSILLCSNEKKIDEKEKLKLIEYLLYKFTDHKQLLSKLKVLTMKKKINVTKNNKLHTENEIADSIMSNIFAYLDFTDICIPDDIISLLKRNNKEYKNIVNWYFKTATCKKSDRIIKKLIENMSNDETVIPNYSIREGDINSIDIKELEAFDAQIQKHFKTNKMDNKETMLVNRTTAIIKTLLTKNGTDNYKMYKMLHENNICDKEITRKYFKTLRIKDIKKFMMTYVKFLEEDPSMIVFMNNIMKVCEKHNYKFKWKRVFAVFAANDEYDNFDSIDCEKVPCEIFYKSLKSAVKIERYKSFARKVINTDHDTDLLTKYIKKYYEDEFRCIQELLQKRIDELLSKNN